MDANKIRALIQKLLAEVEEEDISISLLSRQYQNEQELAFFSEVEREKVERALEQLVEDSLRHKKMLEDLIHFFGEKIHGS